MDIKTFKKTQLFPRGTRFEFHATTQHGPVKFVNATRAEVLRLVKAYDAGARASVMECPACMGNVAPGKFCYACGLRGPAGQGAAVRVEVFVP